MAESTENDKKKQDQLADDLDSMLDATVDEVAGQEELIDDEDAIDRLLMDNAFDAPEDDEIDEFAEIDELISDSLEPPAEDVEDVDKLIDEFGDDEFSADEPEETIVEDEAISITSEPEPESEITDNGVDDVTPPATADDIDIEVDDFAEDDVVITEDDESADKVVEPIDTATTESAEPSVASDGFDITAFDDDEISDVEEPGLATQSVAENEQQDYSVDIADIKVQLVALQQALAATEQQASAEVDDGKLATVSEGLESVVNEQKKAGRQLAELEQKKPVLTYVALAIAIIALLLGGGLGVIGIGANSEVEELADTVEVLDESVQAWIAKSNNSDEMLKVTARLDRMDSEVANFGTQLSELDKSVEAKDNNSQVTELQQEVLALKEQLAQTTATLDSVQQKMANVAAVKVARKKAVRKAVSPRKQWTVNLISFKQEWYAKRKAAEFEKKGIPVDVMTIVIKGETWYRLRVKGFATKAAASNYAGKVKKSLNLTSVWVTSE